MALSDEEVRVLLDSVNINIAKDVNKSDHTTSKNVDEKGAVKQA